MGLELRPYQNDAVTFLFERDRAMILAVADGDRCHAR